MTDPTSHTRTVEIPERTAKTISERLSRTEFESVDDYVAFALGQLLREIERQDDDARSMPGSDGENAVDDSSTDEAVADSSKDEAVEDRLESLGYL